MLMQWGFFMPIFTRKDEIQTMKSKFKTRVLSACLAVLMLIGLFPTSAFAAPASDIPKEMLDNVYLDALAYTGYGVQTQKNDGTIFKKYGSTAPSSILSGITYDYTYACSGLETTASGKPDIAKFKQKGLCCASYTSYVYFNYLPNVAGVDTSQISRPANLKSAGSWNTEANSWISSGTARRISFKQNADGSGFSPSEEIPIGSLVVFKNVNGGGIAHVSLYAGCYNGLHFVSHVGNDRGPELMRIDWMSKSDQPEVVAQIVAPSFTSDDGAIEVYKKDTNGKNLSGAVFVATNTETGIQYRIGPTDSSGYAMTNKRIPYGKYTVKETVFPTNYRAYGQTEWTVTVNSSNDGVVTINAVNEEIPGSCKIVKTSEDGKVSGINFKFSGNGVNKTVTTGSGGEILLNDLKPGIYTVTEEAYDKYEPQETRRVTVVSGQTAVVAFNNILKRGNLKVTKSSEDGLIEGVKFRLSGTSLSGIAVNEFAVSNSAGIAEFKDVLIGTGYVLEELDVDIRYVVPEKQSAAVEWNKVAEKSFQNILKKFQITVTKSDAEIGTAQGSASLAGAVYGLYKGNQLTASYTTDPNGQFTTDFYICGDDWSIREISPSEGYLLDETSYHVGAEPRLYTVERNITANDVTEQVKKGSIALIKHTDDGSTQIETPEVGAEFAVYLKSAGSYEKAKAAERDFLTCNEYGFAQTKSLPYGVYTVEQVSGWEGNELIPAFDVFIAKDGQIYRYLVNNSTFESYLKLVKVDAETGKTIPYAGAGFQLYRPDGSLVTQRYTYPSPVTIDTFYTSADGTLITPEPLEYGKGYSLVEREAPYGYVLNSTPVYFDVTAEHATEEGALTVVRVERPNMAQKGIIKISKSGEVFSSVTEADGLYQPVYSVEGLAGAVYKIYANADIVTPDGTVRARKDDLVATVETGMGGNGASGPLYLGSYRILEEKAPYGMVLNKEPAFVELVYAGQEVEVTETAASFYNERQKIRIDLRKVLEQDEDFGIGMNSEIQSVQFGLYAEGPLTASDGKQIPKGALLEILACDENGNAVFTTDVPVGSRLYVKEYATDAHYLISDQQYPVVFEYAGQSEATVNITVNGGEPIGNKLIRGSVIGKKVDEDGFAIAGALFGLFEADETEFTEGTAIMTARSNEIGVFGFDGVPYGNWAIRELIPAPAFILNETLYPVTIIRQGQTIEIEIENRFIVGAVQTTKIDADYPDHKLSGAVFEIYVDVDGNKEFDAKIDKLIGTMDETETGVYRMDGLRYNGYFLYEKTAPVSFVKDDEYHYFTIREAGHTVTVSNNGGTGFANRKIKGDVTTTKVDAAYPDHKLTGAVFEIYRDVNENNVYDKGIDVFISELAEAELGVYTRKDLEYGGYFLYEKTAPASFVKDENYYFFEIRADGELIEVSIDGVIGFPNRKIKGSVGTVKIDAADHSHKLSGAVFEIYRDTDGDGSYTDGVDELVGEMAETDPGVYMLQDLEYGRFFQHEKTAPHGFIRDDKYYAFSIKADGETVWVENEPGIGFVNQPEVPEQPEQPGIPQTGDSGNLLWLLLAGGSSVTLAALGVTTFRKKRRAKKTK